MVLAILSFGLALGVGTLALPLLAVAAGLDAATIGLLTAVSAVSQFSLRLALPWLLSRFPDRTLISVACLMMGGSYAILIPAQTLLVFLVAQLLQGGARALFWTSNQTHAVRSGRGSVGSLARVQVIANVGTMAGPALAGLVSGISLELALLTGVVFGLAGTVASRGMRVLPAFVRQPHRGEHAIWRRDGVNLACWASFTAGGWRAMQSSYIPILLNGAGMVPSLIGGLLALADLVALGAGAFLIRFTPRNSRGVIMLSVIAEGAGLALLPVFSAQILLVGPAIALGGLGYGMLTTMGPALASDSVRAEERGDALAWAGTFRAASLLAMPAGVALGLSLVSLPVGMTVAAVVLSAPALTASLRTHLRTGMGAAP
jgi:Major Facilitator Superfamily